MKKITLTLFLAFINLVSFAQSTVKTIRIANATKEIGIDIPVGTLVVDLAIGSFYTATLAGGGVESTETITSALALATPKLALLTREESKPAYSVTESTEITVAMASNSTATHPLGKSILNGVVPTADQIKTYLNGALLKAGDYTFTLDSDSGTTGNQSTVTFVGTSYEFDLLTVMYTSND